MSKNKAPAFPTIINHEVLRGMTLRDYFAAQVLQGIYANPEHRYNTHPTDALEAYAMADAMLNFREQA
jgi:hypothetical protein